MLMVDDDSTDTSWINVLILDKITKFDSVTYTVCYNKRIQKMSFQCNIDEDFTFGSIINCLAKINDSTHDLLVKSIGNRRASALEEMNIIVEFDEILGKNLILCDALTNGCFTFEDQEYSTPAAYSNSIGIIADRPTEPKLPKGQIGRMKCAVVAELNEDGGCQFYIHRIISFVKVLSLTMSANVNDNENYGLVTREETDEKRDLRLVSSRDFPRDVRIFKSGLHCCESAIAGSRSYSINGKFGHDHDACIDTGVGNVKLLGTSVAMQVVRCRGMGIGFGPSETAEQVNGMLEEGVGYHVDGRKVRNNVTQLQVHVHGGFVEVETICEYSGFTDHNGYPLLWSHDVEFVVDFLNVFKDKPFGLYIVNTVRFHRQNVFAKWRLARRAPIVKSLQTKFHSKLAHSFNSDEVRRFPEDEPIERQRVASMSRFATRPVSSFARKPLNQNRRHLSCSLPRTDYMEQMPLFDALMQQPSQQERNPDIDENLWKHHDTSVMKIVDDSNGEQS